MQTQKYFAPSPSHLVPAPAALLERPPPELPHVVPGVEVEDEDPGVGHHHLRPRPRPRRHADAGHLPVAAAAAAPALAAAELRAELPDDGTTLSRRHRDLYTVSVPEQFAARVKHQEAAHVVRHHELPARRHGHGHGLHHVGVGEGGEGGALQRELGQGPGPAVGRVYKDDLSRTWSSS